MASQDVTTIGDEGARNLVLVALPSTSEPVTRLVHAKLAQAGQRMPHTRIAIGSGGGFAQDLAEVAAHSSAQAVYVAGFGVERPLMSTLEETRARGRQVRGMFAVDALPSRDRQRELLTGDEALEQITRLVTEPPSGRCTPTAVDMLATHLPGVDGNWHFGGSLVSAGTRCYGARGNSEPRTRMPP